MVAHLIRLKLLLLRNSLRRSPWQLVGLILGGLYGLGMLGLLIVGVFVLTSAEPALSAVTGVIAGSLAVAGWALLPVFLAGADMTLDPARFTTYAVPLRQLLAGLAIGGLIGLPGLLTLLAALGWGLSWWQEPAAAAAGVVFALVAVLTCVALSRVVVTAATSLTGNRRYRDITALVAIVPLMLIGPAVALIPEELEGWGPFLERLAGYLAWTPLGAAWAVPADLALGSPGTAALRGLLALAFLAAALQAWKLLLSRALVTPGHQASAKRTAGRLGFFDRFPATPAGAVAARALTYWFRDPRYGASLLMVPLLAVVLVAAGGNSGPGMLLVLGPLVGFLLGISLAADVAFDNTAFALHLAAGVRGRDDRAGRVLAAATFSVPLTVVAAVLPPLVVGGAPSPAVLGISMALLLCGFGLSSVVSARFTYNVPLPGESPFKTPPGSAGRSLLVNTGSMAALIILCLPALVPAVAALVTGSQVWSWTALALGVGWGIAVMVMGIRIGGTWVDRRGPELLAQVAVHK
ncbi:hypothetical protein BN1051_01898 [Arthrobacter saudimassiliensis]|uniref:Uncharacterized protein n=1 Tax=Arthrobacter saudimassiliensis TaxID=1461584 RepID=A0A078MQH1_9MICC|nr:hypothetical protein BN1051_01898 [Arthrobacter saudimassiliensis]